MRQGRVMKPYVATLEIVEKPKVKKVIVWSALPNPETISRKIAQKFKEEFNQVNYNVVSIEAPYTSIIGANSKTEKELEGLTEEVVEEQQERLKV